MTTTSKTCTWQPTAATAKSPDVTETLQPYVDALRDNGFDVHVPVMAPAMWFRPAAEYVYVTHPDLPGCALVQDAPFARLGQRPQVSVPVQPSREYGNAVVVDFEGSPQDLPAVLRPVMTRSRIAVRFVKEPQIVPVDRRIPSDATLLTGQDQPCPQDPSGIHQVTDGSCDLCGSKNRD